MSSSIEAIDKELRRVYGEAIPNPIHYPQTYMYYVWMYKETQKVKNDIIPN